MEPLLLDCHLSQTRQCGPRRLVHHGRHVVGRLVTDPDGSSDRRIDAAIGGIAGLASGLLGVGGGFFMVPLQVIWARRDQHRAVGTSLAAILPIAVVGAATYYFGRGTPQTDLTVAFFLAVGSVLGAFVGALAARRLSDNALKVIIAILLVAVGLKEVYDAVGGAAPHLITTTIRALAPRDYALIAVGGLVVGVAHRWSPSSPPPRSALSLTIEAETSTSAQRYGWAARARRRRLWAPRSRCGCRRGLWAASSASSCCSRRRAPGPKAPRHAGSSVLLWGPRAVRRGWQR